MKTSRSRAALPVSLQLTERRGVYRLERFTDSREITQVNTKKLYLVLGITKDEVPWQSLVLIFGFQTLSSLCGQSDLLHLLPLPTAIALSSSTFLRVFLPRSTSISLKKLLAAHCLDSTTEIPLIHTQKSPQFQSLTFKGLGRARGTSEGRSPAQSLASAGCNRVTREAGF